MDLDIFSLIFICSVTFIAFTVRVVTGFGSAILLSPIFSNFLPPKEVVVLLILLESFVNFIFILKERIRFNLKEVYAGGFLGTLAGIILFGMISQKIAGLIIGSSMGVLSLIMLAGISFEVKNARLLLTILGFISGSMGVLTGVNGPQIILGLTNQGYDAAFIRTFIITYLIVIDTVILLAFVILGYIKAATIITFVLLTPFVVISYLAGKKILGRMEGDVLKRTILIVVFISSLILVLRYTLGGGMVG
jgi:hypothetical protein